MRHFTLGPSEPLGNFEGMIPLVNDVKHCSPSHLIYHPLKQIGLAERVPRALYEKGGNRNSGQVIPSLLVGFSRRMKRVADKDDEKLLTYTSPSLESDLEVTGYPLVSLHVGSTHEDAHQRAICETASASPSM